MCRWNLPRDGGNRPNRRNAAPTDEGEYHRPRRGATSVPHTTPPGSSSPVALCTNTSHGRANKPPPLVVDVPPASPDLIATPVRVKRANPSPLDTDLRDGSSVRAAAEEGDIGKVKNLIETLDKANITSNK